MAEQLQGQAIEVEDAPMSVTVLPDGGAKISFGGKEEDLSAQEFSCLQRMLASITGKGGR